MATVKCVYCGEKTDKSTAYKVPKSNKQNHFFYYCSEEEYQLYIKMQEEALAEKEAIRLEKEVQKVKKQSESKQRQELIDYIVYEFLDYEHGMPFPTTLTKEISKLNKFYTYSIIKESIVRGEDTIRWAMNNTVSTASEFSKIRYIMTIAEGNIVQVYKEWKQKEEDAKREVSHTASFIDEIDTVTYVKKQESDSILQFLGEDDL